MTGKQLTEQQLRALNHIEENAYNLEKYGASEQFEELCLEAVKRDANSMRYVDNKLLTNDFKIKLYEANPKALRYLEF